MVTQKQSGHGLKVALLVLAASGVLGGCASSGNPKDPIEGFNRAMYGFNDVVDSAAIKPVAQGYDYITPTPVRTAVSNFFGNIADLYIGLNNFLQGKPEQGIGDIGRVAFNTTFGVLGLIDVASSMGLEKHDEDFGQTLGRWGVGDGAYVVLPFLGPRTARDTVGLVVDSYGDPLWYIDHIPLRNSLLALRLVENRADLLPADKVIEEAALDKYTYVRDAYLQMRQNLIMDGEVARDKKAEADSPVLAENTK